MKEKKVGSEDQVPPVIKQVDIYFSDSDLPNDKVLWRLVKLNPPDGLLQFPHCAIIANAKILTVAGDSGSIKKFDFLVVSRRKLACRKLQLLPPNTEQK